MGADFWQEQEQIEQQEYEAWLDMVNAEPMPDVWSTKRVSKREVAARLICDNGPGFSPIRKPYLTGNYHA